MFPNAVTPATLLMATPQSSQDMDAVTTNSAVTAVIYPGDTAILQIDRPRLGVTSSRIFGKLVRRR
jgi:hypothetical protein